MTAQDLIARALRILGVLASGETPSANEANDALGVLNAMLDAWRIESLMVYALRTESLALTGAASYTAGPGGDLNTDRPVRIESAVWRNGAVDSPLSISNAIAFSRIPDKTTAGPPGWFYYEPSYPLGAIHLHPVPASGTLQLTLWTPLSAFALFDEVALPPGYQEAITYQLAARLAAEYGRAVTPDIAVMAKSSKDDIKRLNFRTPIMATGLQGSRYDIRSGQ